MFWLVLTFILGIISYIVYTKNKNSTKCSPNVPQYDHAIIIGGSIGGMATAAYLTKYFSRITIIESDDVLNDKLMKSTPSEILNYRCHLKSPTSLGRLGVPHAYQIHALQGEGHKILRELFPQLDNKLVNEYDVRIYSTKNDLRMTVNDVMFKPKFNERH